MTAIHLHMMKLEGDGERGSEETTMITPPHQHGVAEHIGVLINDTIKRRCYQRRCPNHHRIL